MSRELGAYCVPSTFVTEGIFVDEPFNRVVGLETSTDEILWTPKEFDYDPSGEYNENDVERIELPVNDDMREIIETFFRKHLADTSSRQNEYNCHSFAFSIVGVEVQYPGLQEAVSVIEKGERQEVPLRLGQLGVFGGKHKSTNYARPDHSAIGTEDPERCIQIMGVAGYLGLTPYESILRHYMSKPRKMMNVNEYGIYVPSLR